MGTGWADSAQAFCCHQMALRHLQKTTEWLSHKGFCQSVPTFLKWREYISVMQHTADKSVAFLIHGFNYNIRSLELNYLLSSNFLLAKMKNFIELLCSAIHQRQQHWRLGHRHFLEQDLQRLSFRKSRSKTYHTLDFNTRGQWWKASLTNPLVSTG